MSHTLEYTELSTKAYERIKHLIISNQLAPGEKIIQEKLAADLGVSRMPLHKAFQRLENEYLVKCIPRKGIFVRHINIPDIIEAFECRAGLEGVAAIKVANTISEQEVAALEALIAPFNDKSGIDEVNYMSMDHEFHETIIRLSGNKLIQHLNNIGSVLIRTFPKGIILPIQESIDDHHKILEAFKTKNASRAESLLKKHSYKARDLLEKELNQIT